MVKKFEKYYCDRCNNEIDIIIEDWMTDINLESKFPIDNGDEEKGIYIVKPNNITKNWHYNDLCEKCSNELKKRIYTFNKEMNEFFKVEE